MQAKANKFVTKKSKYHVSYYLLIALLLLVSIK